MIFSLPHPSLAHAKSWLAGFLLLLLASVCPLVAPASAATEEQILEQPHSTTTTHDSNQHTDIVSDDDSALGFSTPAPALDDQPINIDGHILIIASSITVIAGAGTALLMLRRKSVA